MLGCLQRAVALEVWTMLDYQSADEQAFEWSLGALDLFVLTASRPGDIEDVRHGCHPLQVAEHLKSLTRNRFSRNSTFT